jgi:hypothetical protein
MSIYGLSSELTARRAVYVLHKCAPPRCPIIPAYKGRLYMATRARGTDVGTTRGRKCPGTNYTTVFIPHVQPASNTAACRTTSARNGSRANESVARNIVILLLLLLLLPLILWYLYIRV